MNRWLSSIVWILALPGFAQVRSAFTEAQLDNYARAVLLIEQKREEVLKRAKQLPVWESAVQQADKQGVGICDLKPPEPQLQALCQEMFRHAKETIERYGFDNQEFNLITRSQQTDKELQKRLQQKVAELRAGQSRR
ncbi:MAG: DUF4168 domain-containing protein [Pseudanabaenaceae cyanobacterium SKYGB_i_bin29]|nr:DUF4168 domain-containing protein [Pseudanabaenaceae cyanobacterium SKYG29]MDW8422596.1 DUF4168 domain-containing protein [Pseudanabaenaceae cyanobacterium SKYGB_i_bin29]